MTLATIVDTADLLEVLWTSALAGVGVTAAYGTALLGIDRAVDNGREGRTVEAAAYGALAVVAGAVVAAALVFGGVVMVDK
jgi:hypothetical protein